MVKRAFLDEESVEAAIVPLVGENWISDTKVKGFGLRLYNSKAGPTKRFAIRATDISGKSIRKNFKDQTARYNHSIEWKWDDEFEGVKQPFNWNAPLGLYAKQARDWAFDEIRTLKGLTTLESENDNRRENAKRILNDITLERAAQALVSNYRKMKMSTSYVDRVDKLFTQLVSTALKTKPIRLFSKDDANDLHICCEGLTGNKRTLVPFLGRIFLLHQNLVGGRDVFGMTKGGQFIQKIPDKSFKIDDGNIGKVRALLAFLEGNRLHWR